MSELDAKVQVFEDLAQELDGLWTVLGATSKDSWVAAVCTSREAADDFRRRCEASVELYRKLIGDDPLQRARPVYEFFDCPDTQVDVHSALGVQWHVTKHHIQEARGVFLSIPKKLTNANNLRTTLLFDRSEILRSTLLPAEWVATVHSLLVGMPPREEGFPITRAFRTEIQAKRWVAAVTASINGDDPIQAALAVEEESEESRRDHDQS